MIIGRFTKQPAEKFRLTVDFDKWLAAAETIATVAIEVDVYAADPSYSLVERSAHPTAAGQVIVSQDTNGTVAWSELDGGDYDAPEEVPAGATFVGGVRYVAASPVLVPSYWVADDERSLTLLVTSGDDRVTYKVTVSVETSTGQVKEVELIIGVVEV